MKLALVGPFPPYRGGIAQFTDMLSGAFDRFGDTVERISYRRLYPALLFPGRSQTDSLSPVPHSSVRLVDSVMPNRWISTRREIRALKPDGILAAWWHPFFAPALLGSIPPEIPTGIICHNVNPHESFPLSGFLNDVQFACARVPQEFVRYRAVGWKVFVGGAITKATDE